MDGGCFLDRAPGRVPPRRPHRRSLHARRRAFTPGRARSPSCAPHALPVQASRRRPTRRAGGASSHQRRPRAARGTPRPRSPFARPTGVFRDTRRPSFPPASRFSLRASRRPRAWSARAAAPRRRVKRRAGSGAPAVQAEPSMACGARRRGGDFPSALPHLAWRAGAAPRRGPAGSPIGGSARKRRHPAEPRRPQQITLVSAAIDGRRHLYGPLEGAVAGHAAEVADAARRVRARRASAPARRARPLARARRRRGQTRCSPGRQEPRARDSRGPLALEGGDVTDERSDLRPLGVRAG